MNLQSPINSPTFFRTFQNCLENTCYRFLTIDRNCIFFFLFQKLFWSIVVFDSAKVKNLPFFLCLRQRTFIVVFMAFEIPWWLIFSWLNFHKIWIYNANILHNIYMHIILGRNWRNNFEKQNSITGWEKWTILLFLKLWTSIKIDSNNTFQF